MKNRKNPGQAAVPCVKKATPAIAPTKPVPVVATAETDDPKALYYEDAAQFKNNKEMKAALATSSVIRGAVTGRAFATPMFDDDLDLTEYTKQLAKQSEAVLAGDLNGVKTMLVTQAATLDMIFNQLARRSSYSEYLSQRDAHLRLALKAQSQCRTTLETLAEILNPRAVAFVRQQTNISSEGGPQQVNVGTSAPPSAPAREGKPKPSNELLEQSNGEWLDTGAAGQTGRGNTTLAAVGAIDRSQD